MHWNKYFGYKKSLHIHQFRHLIWKGVRITVSVVGDKQEASLLWIQFDLSTAKIEFTDKIVSLFKIFRKYWFIFWYFDVHVDFWFYGVVVLDKIHGRINPSNQTLTLFSIYTNCMFATRNNKHYIYPDLYKKIFRRVLTDCQMLNRIATSICCFSTRRHVDGLSCIYRPRFIRCGMLAARASLRVLTYKIV